MTDPDNPGALSAALEPFALFADLRPPKAVGRPYACLWCGGEFRPRRANQDYCGQECAGEAKAFRLAYGQALVEPLLVYLAGYKAPRDSEAKVRSNAAWSWLLRRGRELRDLQAEKAAARRARRDVA